MDIRISRGQFHDSEVEAISSKSFVHRLLIAAALSKEPVRICTNIISKDMKATAECLKSLGADIETEVGGFLVKKGISLCDRAELFCDESGSTARFMLPLTAYLCREFEMTGAGRLPERPFKPLCDALRIHGIDIDSDFLPIHGSGKLSGGVYTLPGDISSQYITGLMFALPLISEDSRIELTSELKSASYIDITLEVLKIFGIDIKYTNRCYIIKGGQTYRAPKLLKAEGDWSNAGFLLSMGAIGESIIIKGLNKDSVQGDRRITDVLKMFGANVNTTEDVVVGKNILEGIDFDVSDIPDLVPAIAMVAAFAEGTTKLRHVERLRLKESDRIEAIRCILGSLGAENYIEENNGSIHLFIEGIKASPEKEITIDSFGDHRMVMAGAIAAIGAGVPIIIKNSGAVDKSYPGFFEVLKSMGMTVEEVASAL